MEKKVNLNEEETMNTEENQNELAETKEKKTMMQRIKGLGKVGKGLLIGGGVALLGAAALAVKFVINALSSDDENDEQEVIEEASEDIEVSEE